MIDWINGFLDSKAFRYLRIGQFLLALGIFTYMALMPTPSLIISGPDYALHFIGNVLLYLSACVALFSRIKLFYLLILLTPYSFCTELAQLMSPWRHVDVGDMLFNLMGLVVGFFIALLVRYAWAKVSK